MNGYTHRCGKVLGGIKGIMLTEKCNIGEIRFDPATDSYTSISFVDQEKLSCCTLRESEARYSENIRSENGILSVTHVLEFSTDKMDNDSRNLLHEIAAASLCGIVAVVTTRNNDNFLVGYSEEHRDQRPMYLSASTAQSGNAHTDACGETLTLQSCDTAKARLFSGNIG